MTPRLLRRRRRGRARTAGLLALAWGLACGSPGVHEAYRAAHPGWEASLPRAPGGIPEIVAALHAPSEVEGVRVENVRLEILTLGAPPWRAVGVEALRDGRFQPAPAGDHAVVAVRRCRFDEGLRVREEERIAYYLLRAGRLVAYDHYAFGARCAVRDQFFAARGEAAALETALSAWIREHVGRRRLDLPQTYRRGLAYVEAGRLEEARALARIAERAYRAAVLEARRQGAPAQALRDVERLRGRLHGALGISAPRR